MEPQIILNELHLCYAQLVVAPTFDEIVTYINNAERLYKKQESSYVKHFVQKLNIPPKNTKLIQNSRTRAHKKYWKVRKYDKMFFYG